MAEIRFSALWATSGVAIALIAFGINFWITEGPFPGYKILAYPGIFATQFFSEEINFWPKLGIMLSGQYIVFFVVILASKHLVKLLLHRKINCT